MAGTNGKATRTRGGLDVARVRRDFPVLRTTQGGRRLVYLDSAATAQKPRVVIDRIREFYATEYAKNQTPYRLGKHSTDAYEASRAAAAKFLNARGPDEIVLTELEHHSNIVPWHMACEQTGAKIRVAKLDANGDLDLDHLASLLTDKAKVVAVSHVSNVLGGRQPVEEVVKLAHARDIPVLVDGAQAAPHVPVDVRKIGCDFYAFSGHKTYGPSGVGVLYGTREWLDKLPPSLGGEPMAAEVTFEGYTPKPPPEKFAAGVLALASTVALSDALAYLSGLGRQKVAAHVRAHAAVAAAGLGVIDGVTVLGSPADRVSVVTFTVEGTEAQQVAEYLDRTAAIAVRSGHLSAQPLLKTFGLDSAVRASFAAYNTPAEVELLIEAVGRCARRAGT